MAWIYTYGTTGAFSAGPSTSGWQPQNYGYGGVVTFAEAGTVDQLSAHGWIDDASAANIKLALYDTSGNLVADAGILAIPSGTADPGAWRDSATFTPVSVSAGDYVVISIADTNQWYQRYDNTNDGAYTSNIGYASFPADPETGLDIDGETNLGYMRRVNFTAGSSPDALLADDVESASSVSAPAVGQTHALVSVDVESASQVSTPAVGQAHVLVSVDVESASQVGVPVVGQTHALVSVDVESTSQVSTPALADVGGTVDPLLADDVESSSEVTAPVLTQVHSLLSGGVESGSEISIPALGQQHALLSSSVESVSEVGTPTLLEDNGIDELFAVSVQSLSVLSTPRLNRTSVTLNYAPRPVPLSVSPEMREYLDDEFSTIAYIINEMRNA